MSDLPANMNSNNSRQIWQCNMMKQYPYLYHDGLLISISPHVHYDLYIPKGNIEWNGCWIVLV